MGSSCATASTARYVRSENDNDGAWMECAGELTRSFPCPSLLVVVEQLAMSRALGDYQYKGNVGLGPEHQMVRA